MQLKPNYVAKDKTKVNYKLVVPFVVIAAILFTLALDQLIPKEVVDQGTSICNLSGRESAKVIAKRKYPASITLGDYAQYGESLALFHEPYQVGVPDLFSGKTIFLNNLCLGDERAYMMDVELDRKLTLTDLDDGFYELEILEGLDRFFLKSDLEINESYQTINRQGLIQEVKLMADKNMFKMEDKSIHQENYVYLEVKTIEDPGVAYDLVIDPARFNELWEGFIDYGASAEGITEADYTYQLALKLEEKLKGAGMRVKVLRDDITPKNFSGQGGRLEEAYASGAKYYIALAFPYSGSQNDYGSTMIYSSHASNSLATEISRSLSAKTSLQTSNWSGKDDIAGVYPSNREGAYDRTQEIRESGGLLTGAGHLIDNPFGKDNPLGMEAVYLELGFMSKKEDLKAMKNEVDGIAQAIADAIVKNLGL